MNTHLISKYNVAGPRYTSYPTVPYWDENAFSIESWKNTLQKSFQKTNSTEGISLYIHLPFCSQLCTFCGCHKHITKKREVQDPYIEALIQEWKLYSALLSEKPVIKEVHLGGGTPTFFSPKKLCFLIRSIFNFANESPNIMMSFEGHPNSTTEEHLKTLFGLGFRRVSYGVQDYNSVVQKAINRIQPFENIKAVTNQSRKEGFTSVGHDIIFGLPFQTKEHILHTIERTKELLPDRVAFYSYAHVPWIKGTGQRGFKEEDLPSPEVKREMYEIGKEKLQDAGYVEIGMDHFSLKSDSLYNALENKTLHRNFMGYTESKTEVMIGLGISSIGDSWCGYGQNVKTVKTYQDLVKKEVIPIYRGHILSKEDIVIRKHILNIMCKLSTSWEEKELYFTELPKILIHLKEMEGDGLIQTQAKKLIITEKGRPFVRNVCMAFDMRLQRKYPETRIFSMTI